jgi:hypothetical protein
VASPPTLSIAGAASGAPAFRATPSGRLIVNPGTGDLDVVQAGVAAAFAAGAERGLLFLGAGETGALLPPVLAYFRDFGRAFVGALCQTPDVDRALAEGGIPVDEPALDRAAGAVPPMPGAEYLDREALRRLWSGMADALRAEVERQREKVADFLARQSPMWHQVGRVHFHLAENRRDPERPFAFLATYTIGVTGGAKVQHAPLGQALREHAGARNRQALLSLLAPVQRAAEQCAWVKEMVASGAVYRPTAFGPDEALRFLRDLDALERAGLIVKVPDLWRGRRPPRPEVRATVGSRAPSALGSEALLDFDVGLALDGERLTGKEAREILAATSGLVLLRGPRGRAL